MFTVNGGGTGSAAAEELKAALEAEKAAREAAYAALSDRIDVFSETDTGIFADRLYALEAAVGAMHADSWEDVQRIVDAGFGAVAFPVGTQFVTPNSDLGDVVWEVADHQDVEDAGGNMVHGMQLLMYYVNNTAIAYDAVEMMATFEDGLPAGTYYFTIPAGYSPSYNDLITDEDTETTPIQFTTTKDIPPGGGIRLNWSSGTNLSEASVYTYPDNITAYSATNENTEKCEISRGTDGTFIGAIQGSYIDGNLNGLSRNRYGSNNYKESAIRQYLNASGESDTYWQPQTPFDRKPTYVSTMPGFMHGFEDDFLAAVCPVKITTCTNDYAEVNDAVKSSYTTVDKFYLPSATEIAGRTTNGISEGKRFALMKGYSNNDFVKRQKSGTARAWLFRTPYVSNAYQVHQCNASGNTSVNQLSRPSESSYFAAACTIAKSKA